MSDDAETKRLWRALKKVAPPCHICGTKSDKHMEDCSACGDGADRILMAPEPDLRRVRAAWNRRTERPHD